MSYISRRRIVQFLAAMSFTRFASACGLGGATENNPSGSSGSSDSGAPTTASAGDSVTIPYPLYGLNSGDNLAHFLDDTSFMTAFGDLKPSILRYPGGNSANWFDLSTGLLLTDATPPPPSGQLSAFTTPPAFTFCALAALLEKADAQSTIVLNLLTGDMQSQIEDLRDAKGEISIRRIELGNEYYLNGVHGDQYIQVFPTAQDYAKAANAYASAIKSVFPHAELGVPVETSSGGGTRQSTWNKTLVPILSKDIDALIVHNYQDPPEPPFTGASVKADARTLAAPGGVAAILSRVSTGTDNIKNVANTWPGYKIWNTETNLRDFVGAVAGTWTHGLYVAYQLLSLLEVPNIAQALVHAVTNGTTYSAIWTTSGTFPNSSVQYHQGSLSASGISMQIVFRAACHKTKARQLSISTNPAQQGSNGGSAPSLYGWILGNHESSVVLNLSATAYALTFHNEHLFAGAAYTQLSGEPTAYVGTPNNLTSAQGSFDTRCGLTLPPYSITLFETC